MESPTTMLDFMHQFPDDNACRAYLEKMRWPNGFVCSRCRGTKVSHIASRRLRQCDTCRYPVSVTAGTLSANIDKIRQGNDHCHAMDPDDVREFVAAQREPATTLGDCRQAVLECGVPARKFARLSLFAARDIAAGTVITAAGLIPKRPGTGISPRMEDIVVCRRASSAIAEDTVLTSSLFE